MMRLLVIAVLAVMAYRMAFGRWPWQPRLDARARRLRRARNALGVGAGAGREEIVSAHRRAVATAHPDRGGSSAGVHAANEARDLLLAEISQYPIHQGKEPK